MCISELLRYVGTYLSGMPQVTFVADQDSRHLLAQGMLTALLDPQRKTSETSSIGDIVDKHHSVDIAVIVLYHTLSKALLACSVPQLDLAEGEQGALLAVNLYHTCIFVLLKG